MSKIEIKDNKINEKPIDYESMSKVEFCPVLIDAAKPIVNIENAFKFKPIYKIEQKYNFTANELKKYITL